MSEKNEFSEKYLNNVTELQAFMKNGGYISQENAQNIMANGSEECKNLVNEQFALMNLLIKKGSPREVHLSDSESQIFLKKFIAFNMAGQHGETALELAIGHYQHVEIVTYLLKHSSDVSNILNRGVMTPLMNACYFSENIDTVRAILEYNPNPNIQDSYGRTALMYVFLDKKYIDTDEESENLVETIEALINCDGIDVNIQDNNGNTALMYSLNPIDYKYNFVRAMLNCNAHNINIKNKKGQTALILYLMNYIDDDEDNDKIKIVSALIEYGADVNIQDMHGNTALTYTQEEDIVNILIENGAKHNTD